MSPNVNLFKFTGVCNNCTPRCTAHVIVFVSIIVLLLGSLLPFPGSCDVRSDVKYFYIPVPMKLYLWCTFYLSSVPLTSSIKKFYRKTFFINLK